MTKLLKVAANSLAFLYSSVVVIMFISIGFIVIAAIATVIAGLLGLF